jgi:hypothetical protein
MPTTIAIRVSPQREHAEQHRSDGKRNKGPGRPTLGAALNQRVDDGGQCDADQHHPASVQSDPWVRDRLRQYPDSPGQRRDANRHVDQEHQSPSDTPQVGFDQRTGQDRRGKDGEAHHRPEGAEHLGDLLVVEDLFDHPEPLGYHQRPERALQHSEHDQYLHRRSDRAGGGHHCEACGPDQEQSAPAEHVAQAGASDQEDGEGQRVARGQPLQGGALPPRAALIDGPATLTIVASTRSMMLAAITTANTNQRSGLRAASRISPASTSVVILAPN